MHFKNVLLKISLILISLFVALVLLEFFLRVFRPQSTIDNVISINDYSCYQTLPYYFVGLKPNTNCPFRSIEGSFKPFYARINNLGLRGKDIAEKKPVDTKRILYIGDSFTFGIGVKDNETFSQIAQRALSRKVKEVKFESLNAGVPGTETGYDYLFLKNIGMKLKPDIIIVGFYLQNDITEMSYQTWVNTKHGLPERIDSNYVEVRSGKLLPNNFPVRYSTPILNHSHVFSLLTGLLPGQNIQLPNVKITNIDQLFNPETCVYKVQCHKLDTTKARMKKVFLEIKKLADQNNSKLIVLIIPAAFDISPRINTFQFGITIPLTSFDKNYAESEFLNFFNDNGISYIDPREKMRTYNNRLYFKTDFHLNSLGHQIIGSLISDDLAKYFKQSSTNSATVK